MRISEGVLDVYALDRNLRADNIYLVRLFRHIVIWRAVFVTSLILRSGIYGALNTLSEAFVRQIAL